MFFAANFQPLLFSVTDVSKSHRNWVGGWLIDQQFSLQPTNDPSIEWINPDGAPLSIESVREMITRLAYTPISQKQRVATILYLDSASEEAQNALLKTLEEPPSSTQFILTCRNLTKVLPTIKSRCQIQTIFHDQNNTGGEKNSSIQEIELDSFASAIALAEKYADRESAQNQLRFWIQTWSLTELSGSYPKINILQQTLEFLNQNANVKLALENGFFQLVTLRLT